MVRNQRSKANLRRLLSLLDQAGRSWVTAKEIHRITGWHRRSISALTEQAAGAILAHTQHGYKLTLHATRQDILSTYKDHYKCAQQRERRARSVISFAKRKGLLPDADEAQARTHEEVEKELTNERIPRRDAVDQSMPRTPAPAPAKDKPLHIEQTEMFGPP